MRKQIVSHLETNNLMDPDQHGSRQGRSCLSQLLEHHDEVLKMMENGGNVDVIYTDFAKAYEKIDHAKLLHKLKTQFGIDGKLGKWLEQFLKNRKQKVLVEETTSEESKVVSGSVQGSVLGPVLFLMYIKYHAIYLHRELLNKKNKKKLFIHILSAANHRHGIKLSE